MKIFWRVFLVLILLLGGGGVAYYFLHNKPPKPVTVKAKEEVIKDDDIVPTATKIPINKVWSFSFDEPLNPASVTADNIVMKDKDNKEIPVQIQLLNGNKTIQISPPSEGYQKGTYYSLHIINGVKSGISYANGNPVSKPYDLNFITERDTVEKAEYNPNLIMVKSDQIQSKQKNTLKLDKSVKKGLKKDDIIVIPSKENEVGKALKITSVKKGINTYTVDVKEPHFGELFENLDVYNSYEIKPENIKMEKGIKGISLEPVGQLETNTAIASSDTPTENGEYAMPTLKQAYSKTKGYEFSLANLELKDKDGTKVVLSGDVNIMNPKVNVDTKVKAAKLQKMIFSHKTHMEENVTAELAGFETEKDKSKDFFRIEKDKEKLESKLRIAKVSIPIPAVPGLEVEGAFYLEFKATLAGSQEVTISFEVDDEKGISYNGKKTEVISSFDPNFDMTYLGKSEGEVSFGPKLKFGLEALEVVGAGVEGFAGAKLNGQIAQEESIKQEDYFCAKAYIAAVAEASVYADLHIPFITDEDEHWKELKLAEKEFLKKSFNTCNSFESISSKKKSLSINSAESVDVEVLAKYIDLLTEERSQEKIKSHKILGITVADKGVVQVNKNNSNVIVKANDLPSKENTTMTITYTTNDKAYRKQKTGTIKIPIRIKNYAQVLKRKQELESVNAWKGQWARNTSYAVGDMRITNVTPTSFYYEIHIVGAIYSGTAQIYGKKAVDKFEGSNCDVTFTLNQNTIDVLQPDMCVPAEEDGSTILTLQSGTYERGAPRVEQDEQPQFYD